MMDRRTIFRLTVALSLAARAAAAPAPDLGTDAQREAGKQLYVVHCAQCHGEKGDGQGIAAPFLLPRPRDFTAGKFKIRNTPSGALPTTEDLRHIIRVGMPYTAMPAWPQFDDQAVTNLAYYVKAFSPDFANPDRQPEAIEIAAPPALSEASIEKGKQLYGELGCARCHGESGRGDGISAPTLKDDWKNPIRPADLTQRWTFRGGPTRTDIFRAFSTGLNGTPMPSFVDALSVEQRWDLAAYVSSLSPAETPNYATVVVAKKVQRPLELEHAAELFTDAQTAFLPVIGQVIQPGREFHPPLNGVSVRAVYNDSDIAIELRWDDRRADTTGANAPNLPVPASEDAGEPAAKPAEATDEGDVWGGAEAAPAAAPAAEGEKDIWGGEEAGAAAAAPPASEFSDAVAIQLPVEPPTTIRKPYVVFGDKDFPINLWFVDLARQTPELWLGRGSDTLEALGARALSATSTYDKGEWTVVFKRRLRSRGEVAFEEGGFLPIALSVWDGSLRERGNKRALSTWWTVYLSPGDPPSPLREMAKWAGLALGLELAFIGWARRRTRPSSAA
ncbi:MAG TPA: c-type cytochrome [Candidatus Dormibacteraeota bacterium]|nr:c-type cytochrome [Candidatus Dormibacteraeota bacterium]